MRLSFLGHRPADGRDARLHRAVKIHQNGYSKRPSTFIVIAANWIALSLHNDIIISGLQMEYYYIAVNPLDESLHLFVWGRVMKLHNQPTPALKVHVCRRMYVCARVHSYLWLTHMSRSPRLCWQHVDDSAHSTHSPRVHINCTHTLLEHAVYITGQCIVT